MNKKVGVLALQGGFSEHVSMFSLLGVKAIPVRAASDLAACEALVIPGGESTTIGSLLTHELSRLIQTKVSDGMFCWGTCAGAILLGNQNLGLIDVEVERNAYGSQQASFVQDMKVADCVSKDRLPGVFIRAPRFTQIGQAATPLAWLPSDASVTACQEDHILITAFHPELTDSLVFHKYFLSLID